jgi:hypothetical protein
MARPFTRTHEVDGVTYRVCARCERDLPLDAEHYYRSTIPGGGGWEFRCKECERERARWRNMLKLYGLTREDYEAMLEAQDGHCACCPATSSDGRLLDVDHDHLTGLNRGLLCRSCNIILGHVSDDPVHLERLAEYLRANAIPVSE